MLLIYQRINFNAISRNRFQIKIQQMFECHSKDGLFRDIPKKGFSLKVVNTLNLFQTNPWDHMSNAVNFEAGLQV